MPRGALGYDSRDDFQLTVGNGTDHHERFGTFNDRFGQGRIRGSCKVINFYHDEAGNVIETHEAHLDFDACVAFFDNFHFV